MDVLMNINPDQRSRSLRLLLPMACCWLNLLTIIPAAAQQYRLTSGEVRFYSEAPMENIEAHNRQAKSIFDAATGDIAFMVPIKGFQFKKALMQEHFNENYLESDQYPHASFEGKLTGYQQEVNRPQQVRATGKLTIHGITQEVDVPGELSADKQQLKMQAKFPVRLADYQIKIPSVVFYNIAEVVEVTVNFTYETNIP